MTVRKTIETAHVPVQVWTEDVDAASRQQLENIASLPFVHHHVAAMPDVHLGKGATVGTVIATKRAIVPAAVGVDIGCFVGTTRIPLLNGSQRSLEELTSESEPFWVYSINASGDVVPGRARSLKTRVNAELVVVTISGGEEIVCTPDHRFMLNDGSYREAGQLRSNTSLMPLYRRWQTRDGYESCGNGKGSQRLTHELVYESLVGAIPNGFVVHHVDHRNFNNSPENLRLVERGKHSSHHRLTGHKFDNASPDFQAKRREGIARRAKDPIELVKMVAVGTANILGFMSGRREEFLASVAGNGARGAPYLSRFNTSPRTCSDCGEEHPNPAALRWHKHRVHAYNHKVISVRPAGYRADVYCLSVEEHHNFALAAGVFVHNCGMAAVRTTLKASDLEEGTLRKVFEQISRDVPLGFDQHRDDRAPRDVALSFKPALDSILAKHPDIVNKKSRSDWVCQLGSLGGGNHFIELCVDEADHVWAMVHSGSRGIGNRIGSYFIEQAREEAHRRNRSLPDRDLAWLDEGTQDFSDYVEAVGWAQDYARANRDVMMDLVLRAMRRHLPPFETAEHAVNCHHNYVQRERHYGADVWVTRKGAIRAGQGELGIIPGSMGAKSYIVRGKGNPESFESSAHGAGRRMSRNEANKRFSAADVIEQTQGVVCRKDKGVVDEIPGAYKDIDEVMANQQDLVEVVHTLKQVLCVKG